MYVELLAPTTLSDPDLLEAILAAKQHQMPLEGLKRIDLHLGVVGLGVMSWGLGVMG